MPFDLCIFFFDVIRQQIGRFPNNFKISNDRINGFVITLKLLKGYAFCIFKNLITGIQFSVSFPVSFT